MLRSNEFGYAVMTKELDAYSFESINLDDCKRLCYKGYVIAERIPYVCGFSVSVRWHKFYKWFEFKPKFRYANLFHIHLHWHKEYLHKTGKIIYNPE